MSKTPGACLILPVLNAEKHFEEWVEGYSSQNCMPEKFNVIDSTSTDLTVHLFEKVADNVEVIDRKDFNHGGTRNYGLKGLNDTDVVIFLTQDAILAGPHAIERIISAFEEPSVAAAYGRQLPRDGAGYIESHARYANYPPNSEIRSKRDIPLRGFKTAFLSNSFAAYRVSALREVGGFPTNVILGEDFYVAAKLLMRDWRIAYVANSCVKHSHDYNVIDEARRYFDIGVFHSSNKWLFDLLGRAGGEGLKFIKSEVLFLLRRRPLLIPEAILRSICKLLFYKLGLAHNFIPNNFRKLLSMHKFYWE